MAEVGELNTRVKTCMIHNQIMRKIESEGVLEKNSNEPNLDLNRWVISLAV